MNDHRYSSISPDPVVRFGATAAEWLERWDEGSMVWSVEMGGLGPSYEQCIQIAAAEIVRDMINNNLDASKWIGTKEGNERWTKESDAIDERVSKLPSVANLGITGAQWGAALSLASGLYMRTPVVALSDPEIKDRLIQVKRDFP